MSEKITKVKVKQADGTFGNPIPIGALADNIILSDGVSVEDALGNINTGTNGTVKEQIDAKINLSAIINNVTTTSTGTVLDGRQGKILQDQIDDLEDDKKPYSIGTLIPDNSDLDNYKTTGKYYISTGSSAATLSNTPITN